jgi:hypothetical protein
MVPLAQREQVWDPEATRMLGSTEVRNMQCRTSSRGSTLITLIGSPLGQGVTAMFFQVVFVSLLLLVFGALFSLAGYRLFVLLLPLWGFFAGFLVTAQAIQDLFGGGFLATTSSWVFGFLFGLVFAVAAYFFYYAAIVILAATVGFELGTGLMIGLHVHSGLLQFIVGLVVAAALTAAVMLLNVPKLSIVVLSALAGASMVLAGILLALGRIALPALGGGYVGAFIRASWFWALVYLAIVAVGIVAQMRVPDAYQLEAYSHDQTTFQAPTPGQTAPAPAPATAGAAAEAPGAVGLSPS